jgi:hypothetical protein
MSPRTSKSTPQTSSRKPAPQSASPNRERLLSKGQQPHAVVDAIRQHARTINSEVLPDERYAAYGGIAASAKRIS